MVEIDACVFAACVHSLVTLGEIMDDRKEFSIDPLKSPSGVPKGWALLVPEIRSKVSPSTPTNPDERRKKQDRLLALDRFENIVRHGTGLLIQTSNTLKRKH